MKDIYEMLNEAEIDLNKYEEIPLNDLEKKKLKKALKSKLNIKKTYGKKIVTIAAIAAFLLITGIVGLSSNPSFASKIPLIGGIIRDKAGYGNSEFDNYTDVLNQSLDINGYKITLKEVALDDNEIRIATTVESNEILTSEMLMTDMPKVCINGKWLNAGGSATQEKDDNVYLTIDKLDIIGKNIPEKLSLKVVYNVITVIDPKTGNELTSVKGPWEFNFNVSKEKIVAKTKKYKINKTLSMSSGNTMELKNLILSPLSTSLSFKTNSFNEYFNFIIRDDKGRELITEESSCSSGGIMGTGRSVGNMSFSSVLKDAKVLTFIPIELDKGRLIPNELVEVNNKYPLLLHQDKKNTIKVSKVEKKDDGIYVEYTTDGISTELQKYGICLFDENKNPLQLDKSKGNLEKPSYKGENFTAVFKNNGSNKLFIGAYDIRNIIIHEDKSFKIKLD